MKLIDTMIAWQPTAACKPHTTPICCGIHPAPRPSWLSPYSCTDGACWVAWRQLADLERLEHLFGLFGSLTVADKAPAEVVHEAFKEIDEHRAVVSGPATIGRRRHASGSRGRGPPGAP